MAQILRFEPKGVDRSCDCIGFECVDARGKNVEALVLTQAVHVTRIGGGIGVLGVYVPIGDLSKYLSTFMPHRSEIEYC